MKKMFISVIALAMSMMAMATEEAFVRIRFNGASGGESVVRLYQDDANTPEYESSFDSDKMLEQSNSKSVLIYGIVGTHKCEDVVTNNLQGVEIGFVTNQVDAANYKFTFENPRGLALQLYDRVEDKLLDMTNNATYTFDAAAGRAEINNRFVIGAPVVTGYTVTPNAAGYATFSAAEATVIPSGVTAVYRGVIAGEELQLFAITDFVPANTGVIVEGVAGTDYNFAIASTSVPALSEDNDLRPTSAYNYPMENVFVLKGDAFLEYIGTTALKANKAFIQLSAQSAAPKRIRMVVNQATGVENAAVEVKAEKFIKNGQVLIRRGNEVYNLQGQIVK